MRSLAPAALAALALLHAPALRAQPATDLLRFGAVAGSGSYTVPIKLADTATTPLGLDRPAGQRIQALAVTVRFEPETSVSSASLVRSGLLAGRTPVFETTATGAGTLTWVGSFDEASGPIPYTQPPGSAGDAVLELKVTLAPGTTVRASLEADATSLSNLGGTTSESAADATLALGPPVALPAGADAPALPTAGTSALVALALSIAASGRLLAARR